MTTTATDLNAIDIAVLTVATQNLLNIATEEAQGEGEGATYWAEVRTNSEATLAEGPSARRRSS